MKKTILFFALLFAAFTAFAQGKLVATYHAESYSSSFSSHEEDRTRIAEIYRSAKQPAGEMPRLPVHKWVKIFDPKNQKLVGTLRLVRLRMANRYSFQYDSSFVLVLHDEYVKQTIAFDNNTKTLTISDSNNIKTKDYRFNFGAPKSTCTVRSFYNNGKTQTEKTYESADFLSIFSPSNEEYDNSLLETLLPTLADHNKIHVAEYFYNGKPYWAADIYEIPDENSYFYKNITMYDSLGKKQNSALYYNPKNELSDKNGVWFSFQNNGKIDQINDYSQKPNCFVSTTYALDGKTIVRKEYKYYHEKTGKDFIEITAKSAAKKRSMFTKEEEKEEEKDEYKALKSDFTYLETEEKTPLWEIKKDENGKLSSIDIFQPSYSALTWAAKICPPTAPFVLEGNYVNGIIPDGEHRIYSPDSTGKKKALLAVINFKNGAPHGKAVSLNEQGDTLASAIYADAKIIYNKYYKTFLHTYYPREFLLDSIETIKKGIDKRAIISQKKQQQAYKNAKKTANKPAPIWQRDSIYVINPTSSYQNGRWVESLNITFTIKEQLTPDSNSSVRVRSFNADKTMYFRYKKQTKELDSVYTEMDEKGKIICRFDPEKHSYKSIRYENWGNRNFYHLLHDNPSFAYMTWEMPNDSVRISSYYMQEDSLDEPMLRYRTVDSFAYTPSFRQKYRNMSFYPNLHLTEKELKYQSYASHDLFSVKPDIKNLNPAYTTTMYEYSPETSKLFKKRHGKDLVFYDENEKPIAKNANGVYEKEIVYFYYAKKDYEKKTNYYDANGNKKREVVDYLANNKKDTEKKEIVTEDIVKRETLFENNQAVSFRNYTKNGQFSVKKWLNTATNMITDTAYSYDRRAMQIRQTSLKYPKSEYGANNSDDSLNLITLQRYYIDSTGKKTLVLTINQDKDSNYTAKTWYLSQKPRTEQAFYFKNNFKLSDFATNTLFKQKIDVNKLTAIDFNNPNYFVQFWENGNLNIQSTNSRLNGRGSGGLIMCSYDENGQIKAEVLGGKTFIYPYVDNKAECAWQNLPYQEGKFKNNRRVGEWRGYFRTNTKKLKYVINYDENGLLDGECRVYGDDSLLSSVKHFKKNKLDGDYIVYEANKTVNITNYKDSNAIANTKFDKKGKIIAKNKGSQLEDTWTDMAEYNPETGLLRTHHLIENQYNVDSVFDEKGVVKEITIKPINDDRTKFDYKKLATTISKHDSTGKWTTTIFKNGSHFVNTNPDYQAFLQKESEAEKMKLTDDDYDDKIFETKQVEVLKTQAISSEINAQIKAFKAIKLDTEPLKSLNIDDNFDEENFRSASGKMSTPNNMYGFKNRQFLTGSKLLLEDSLGHRFELKTKNKDINGVFATQTLVANPATASPVQFNEQFNGYDLSGSIIMRTALKNSVQALSFKQNSAINLSYPAALLHPETAPSENATFALAISGFDYCKTLPRAFTYSEVLEEYHKNYTKQQVLAKINALPSNEQEFFAMESSHFDFTQPYELKKTGVTIAPFYAKLVLGAPIVADDISMNLYYYTKKFIAPMFFPFHQTITNDNELRSDNFLKRSELRLLIQKAEIAIPINNEKKTLEAGNILIADNEINGCFIISKAEAENAAFIIDLEKYFAAKNIKIIKIDANFEKLHPNFDANIKKNKGDEVWFFVVK